MDKFNLKWNDFWASVSQTFSSRRKEKELCDVTLVSDDEVQVPAHKLILSASSSFFKSIFKNNTHPHTLIYLSGVDSTNLEFLLDYIYQGEVQIFQEQLDAFIDVAEKGGQQSLLLYVNLSITQPRVDRLNSNFACRAQMGSSFFRDNFFVLTLFGRHEVKLPLPMFLRQETSS